MKVGVMQPYVFPYLGYFQLIRAVDKFVFYDDVNFIKRGWVNRNRILVNNKGKLISFPCIAASQNKLIKDVKVDLSDKQYSKLLRTIDHAYKKAPFYSHVYPIIEKVFNHTADNIAELAIESVKVISNYLEINTDFYISSDSFGSSKSLDKADRLITITKELGAKKYINAIGGKEIYEKPYFKSQNIDLFFLKPSLPQYMQFSSTNFVKGLSIIDVLMFNSIEDTKSMLLNFDLV